MTIDRLSLPADVRAAAPQQQAVYAAAVQFEQVLLTQLAEAMVPSEEEGGSSQLRQLLPSALADGVTDAGGLGLARSVFEATQRAPVVVVPAARTA
jgi:Rod binding domain-containing protein